MKTCTKCGEEKPLDEYHKKKSGKYGRNSQCKACVSAYTAQWRDANRDHIAASNAANRDRRAEWYAANRDRALRLGAEWRAAKPHMEWAKRYRIRSKAYGHKPVVESFTREELIARHGDACYLCGGGWDQLEHVTPVSRGGEHTLENCRPVCEPCNRRAWSEYLREEGESLV